MRLLSISCALFLVLLGNYSVRGQTDKKSKSVNVTQTARLDTKTTAAERTPAISKISSADQAIRQKLNEPATFSYDETPWGEIEEELEKHYKFNIVLTQSAKDDSLTKDEPNSSNLTGIPLKHSLRLMLRNKNATYVVQDGVLKIISLDEAEDAQWFTTRFINVRPILANIRMLEKDRIGKPRISSSTANDKPDGSENKPIELVTAESLLTDLVLTSYQPDYWQDTGQGLATFKILGGYAIVRADEALADGVQDFLTDLDYHLSQE